MKNKRKSTPITIGAIGDIAFVGKNLSIPSHKIFNRVKNLFDDCDLVIGNLEAPLLDVGRATPGKCSLKSDPGWAAVLKESGINCVSLANNHMMDYGVDGLKSTIETLKVSGLQYSGAGYTLNDACKPLIIEIRGQRVGILSYSSVVVSSHCYAEKDIPGVAPFDLIKTIAQIKKIKKSVDFIIICLHWGIEHYSYPTPSQRNIAKKIERAGADLIIGHHPHTIQGIEKIGEMPVAYSLGNFIFDDFEWELEKYRLIQMNLYEENRIGLVLVADLEKSGITVRKHLFSYIDNNSVIEILSNEKNRRIFYKISRQLSLPWYNLLWKLHSIKMECKLRFSNTISFSKLLKGFWKIRPKHIKQVFSTMYRSIRVVLGKSTNPYD